MLAKAQHPGNPPARQRDHGQRLPGLGGSRFVEEDGESRTHHREHRGNPKSRTRTLIFGFYASHLFPLSSLCSLWRVLGATTLAEDRDNVKEVSRFEADLLRILHFLLRRDPAGHAVELINQEFEAPPCLS